MPHECYVGMLYEFPQKDGGRKVTVTSGNGESQADVERWLYGLQSRPDTEIFGEVWHITIDGATMLGTKASSLKAESYRRMSRTAEDEQRNHINLQRSPLNSRPPVEVPPAPECDEDFVIRQMKKVSDRVEAEKGVPVPMCYVTVVAGWPSTDHTDPTHLRFVPYTDPRAAAGTLAALRASVGPQWVASTWAVWAENEKPINVDVDGEPLSDGQLLSGVYDAYRRMALFSGRLAFGLVPSLTVPGLVWLSERLIGDIMPEAPGTIPDVPAETPQDWHGNAESQGCGYPAPPSVVGDHRDTATAPDGFVGPPDTIQGGSVESVPGGEG